MAVAKSYKELQQHGEPYEKNGRLYIVVECKNGHRKEVRWYTDQEYAKMYPDETKPSADTGICGGKKIRSLKDTLGFEKGYITIFKGDTYPILDWFKESICRYNTMFGWFCPSEKELPELPAGIEPVQLRWEDVAIVEDDCLKSESLVRQAVEALIYEPSPSRYQGEVGDRIERTLTVIKTTELEGGFYGPSTFHLFRDEAGNEYCWTTAARKLELGETYNIKGTIKALQIYKGKEQSVLTRCKVG